MGESNFSVEGAGWLDMAAGGKADSSAETIVFTSGGLMVDGMIAAAMLVSLL
jgi:hypothetical protein